MLMLMIKMLANEIDGQRRLKLESRLMWMEVECQGQADVVNVVELELH